MAEPLQEPADRRHPGWHAMAFFLVAGILIGLIMLASWAPDSRMTALRWVPMWLAEWADRDPNLRTAVPFIPLAFLLVQAFRRLEFRRPLVLSVIVCGLCLGLSELGQIFLPHRTADVRDLLWGGMGIAVGTALAWGMRKF